MSHSRRLRPRDIRHLNELLEEISQLGADPTAWRQYLLHRLCEITHARVGISLELQGAVPGQLMQSVDPVDVGFTDAERNLFIGHMTSNERLIDPGAKAILAGHQERRFYTLRRQEMVNSVDWYASPMVSEGRKSVNIDHFLVSSASLHREGWLTGFALYRNWDESPFDERDQRLVRLFHAGLLRRLRRGAAPAADSPTTIRPYLKQMLRSLLQGHDSSESAETLGLSAHTVKTYTKEIYARLNVTSRGQLMAKLLNAPAGRPIFLPAAFDSAF